MKLQLTILFVLICSLAFGQAYHGTGVRVNKGVILQNGDSAFSATPGGIYRNPTTGHIRFYQGSGFVGLSEPPEIGHKADTSAVWKRTGISNLGTGNIIIRKTTTGNVSIENADGFGFRLNNSNEISRVGDDDNYFEAYAGNVSGFILDSDSLRLTNLSNQDMLITDKRSAPRRWGLRYAGDYSSAIRSTPNALTTMKTVRDVIDSINFITFSDTVSLIATKADISGISGDYWPLSGNFSTTGGQTVTLGGNFRLDGANTIAIDDNQAFMQGANGLKVLSVSDNFLFGLSIYQDFATYQGFIIDSVGTNFGPYPALTAINNNPNRPGLQIFNSGIRTDSGAVNEHRLKTYVEEAIDTLGSGGISESQLEDSLSNYIPKSDTTLTVVTPTQMMDSISSKTEVSVGTWTPAPKSAAVSDGVSFETLTQCHYITISDYVTLNCLIRVNANSSTEFAEIEGLPFSVVGSGNINNFPINSTVKPNIVRGMINATGNTLSLVEGNINAFWTWADLSQGWLVFQVSYKK